MVEVSSVSFLFPVGWLRGTLEADLHSDCSSPYLNGTFILSLLLAVVSKCITNSCMIDKVNPLMRVELHNTKLKQLARTETGSM